MSTPIDQATPGSANPRGRQSISTHRRTTAADTLQAVGVVAFNIAWPRASWWATDAGLGLLP